jgi:transcriptional regulator with XRE-family HTH domain
MQSREYCTKHATEITASQIRAARALLNWSRDRLAEECGVSLRTLVMIEAAGANQRSGTMERICAALTKAGVIFIEKNGGGPGVRLRK